MTYREFTFIKKNSKFKKKYPLNTYLSFFFRNKSSDDFFLYIINLENTRYNLFFSTQYPFVEKTKWL